ncbi:hypothetical protein KAR10_09505, partial [bacterium]|nr:hypothetical protein [bacterium]
SAGAGSYTLNNVPNGEYELIIGDGGPSSYPVLFATVNNGNVTAHFSTNFNANISGTITDNTG